MPLRLIEADIRQDEQVEPSLKKIRPVISPAMTLSAMRKSKAAKAATTALLIVFISSLLVKSPLRLFALGEHEGSVFEVLHILGVHKIDLVTFVAGPVRHPCDLDLNATGEGDSGFLCVNLDLRDFPGPITSSRRP